MKTKALQFILLIAVTTALLSWVNSVHATDSYTYKCPSCGLTETFSTLGMYRFPQDNNIVMMQK